MVRLRAILPAVGWGSPFIYMPLTTIFVSGQRPIIDFSLRLPTLCAMTDDALVDLAAQRNLEMVSKIADRSKIRPRVVDYYEKLASGIKVDYE
jgi:hypothetical protein